VADEVDGGLAAVVELGSHELVSDPVVHARKRMRLRPSVAYAAWAFTGVLAPARPSTRHELGLLCAPRVNPSRLPSHE
jgi:hypothetical protein